VNGKIK